MNVTPIWIKERGATKGYHFLYMDIQIKKKMLILPFNLNLIKKSPTSNIGTCFLSDILQQKQRGHRNLFCHFKESVLQWNHISSWPSEYMGPGPPTKRTINFCSRTRIRWPKVARGHRNLFLLWFYGECIIITYHIYRNKLLGKIKKKYSLFENQFLKKRITFFDVPT